MGVLQLFDMHSDPEEASIKSGRAAFKRGLKSLKAGAADGAGGILSHVDIDDDDDIRRLINDFSHFGEAIKAIRRVNDLVDQEKDATRDKRARAIEVVADGAGHLLLHDDVDEKVRRVFNDVSQLDEMIEAIRHAKDLADKALATCTVGNVSKEVERIGACFGQAIAEVDSLAPYSLCLSCFGKGCGDCNELGWVTKATYDELDEETRREARKELQ
jgi:hypothetical protein